jgi:hypothetical protein
MRMVAISELLRLSRRELLEIQSECLSALPGRLEGSPEHFVLMTNLQNICLVLFCQTITL